MKKIEIVDRVSFHLSDRKMKDGETLYIFTFKLNEFPSSGWKGYFNSIVNTFKNEKSIYPPIFMIQNDTLLINGTIIEELEQIHLDDAKRIIENVNIEYNEKIEKEKHEIEEKAQKQKKENERIAELFNSLKI